MICLIGESASGKSTIEKQLVEKFGYKKIISYTTRPMRNAEVNGVDYHFVDDDTFERMKKDGEFAECAKYRGWQYGTALKDCTDDKVCVVTPHGYRQLKKIPDLNVIGFYIQVSRRERLIKILQRGDDIEEAYRRSLSDVGMFDGIADEVTFTINNDGYLENPYQMAVAVDTKYKMAIEEADVFMGNGMITNDLIATTPWEYIESHCFNGKRNEGNLS